MNTPPPLADGYSRWSKVDYRPASGFLSARSVLPHLQLGQTVLEIGCGNGANAILLAKAGLEVIACDLNAKAIVRARRRAAAHGVADRIQFHVGDFTAAAFASTTVDAIVMVRFLTCLPERQAWDAALARAEDLLSPSGILYVRDFLLDLPHYGPRYQAAAKEGFEYGLFRTRSGSDAIPLITRHHSEKDLATLAQPYYTLQLRRHDGVSMGGNPCSLFEFIGRRRSGVKGNGKRMATVNLGDAAVEVYDAGRFPPHVNLALKDAKKFGLNFSRAYHFSDECLQILHEPDQALRLCRVPLPNNTAGFDAQAELLERIGNYPNPGKMQVKAYLRALLHLYTAQLSNVRDLLANEKVHVIGVKREGATLARHLNLLFEGRSSTPSAKRGGYSGLVIGLADLPVLNENSDVVIIDGAIASGATLMALLLELKPASATIISAHASEQGIRALSRFGAAQKMKITLYAALTANRLNAKYYALADQGNRKAVGDLGDCLETLSRPRGRPAREWQ